MKKLLFSALGLAMCLTATAYDGPTMGWSSWNTFGSNISEATIKGQATAMANLGFLAAGYDHINIDDGFQGGRNKQTGELLIHPQRFPNGLQPVVEHIHNLGLKAGIYSDAGRNTCANYYGSDVLSVDVGLKNYEERDCKFYFDTLDFDFIKVDFCGGSSTQNSYRDNFDPQERYTTIYEAIQKCQKKGIGYNVCRWDYPGTWVHDIASSWRTTGDIYCAWASVKDILAQNLYLSAYCYGGHYNDMDMLEVGRTLTAEEDKTHFGLWCIMASPLLVGCDLTQVSAEARALMLNPELIALNQDSLALQAYVVQHTGGTYILCKDIETLNGPTRAVAFYNPSDAPADMHLTFSEVDLGGRVAVRDLFERHDVDTLSGGLSVSVPAHGTRIYRLTAERRYERELYEGETGYCQRYQELVNASVFHSCTYDACASASGGVVAGYLGMQPDNDLSWAHVYSREGGQYKLTLGYASGENRRLILTVNGEQVLARSLNSGGFQTVATVAVDVQLQKGDNVIRVYTDTEAWMPNVDYIRVERTDGGDHFARLLEPLVSDLIDLSQQPLTATVKHDADSLLALAASEEADTAALITAMQQTITTARTITATCADYETWLASARLNAEASQESDALATLREKMSASLSVYDVATTVSRIRTALTTLKNALKAYLKDDAALPLEGQQLDMTLLLANPDLSASTGWQGSPTYANGVGEARNKTFNILQSLASMRRGVYTATAQALYRGTGDQVPVRFYAGHDSVTVRSLYSVEAPYASTTADAATAFAQGLYPNTVVDTLQAKGTLRVGFLSREKENDSWFCFDDVHLLYAPLPPIEDAISEIKNADSKKQQAYDLQGRPATNATRGIVVRGGRKVIR